VLYGLKQAQIAWYECLSNFSLKVVLGLVRRILLSSLERWVKICSHAKYTLMILPLVLLTNPFVMSLAKSLVGPLSLGVQRNKIPLPYPQSKRSMLSPIDVMHNFYGCDKLSRTMVTL
jgi:hypothetical protein